MKAIFVRWLSAADCWWRQKFGPPALPPGDGGEAVSSPPLLPVPDDYEASCLEIEIILAAGIFAGRLLRLAEAPVFLEMKHSPGSWELRPHHVHRGVWRALGWLTARVRQTDEVILRPELNNPATRYLFITDFVLTARGQGLGSFMLQLLDEIGRTVTPVCRIEGAISCEDWGHVDRLERLYSRHGYRVALTEATHSGNIVKWLTTPAEQVR